MNQPLLIQCPIHVDGSIKKTMELSQTRLYILAIVMTFFFLVIIARLLDIGWVANHAEKRAGRSGLTNVQMQRGSITDRNGITISTNITTTSLYADPRIIPDPKDAAKQLNKIFPEMSVESLAAKLSSGKSFAWIKRRITPREVYLANNLGIPGLFFQKEERRIYPQSNLLSHAVGLVGVDGHGLSGIEKRFDKYLSSSEGREEPLRLSLDVRVQSIMRDELAASIKKFNAVGGIGMVMDVESGEMLSMVSLPDFDPNQPMSIDKDAQFNKATLGVYEMGSTFKTFTMAEALDEGKATFTSGYDATAPLKLANFLIHDSHPENRWLSLPEVFLHSSNIGTARIALDIGEKNQQAFLEKLGFLSPLEFELGERGKPIYPKNWKKLNTATISFGHGIAVTPMHLIAATASMVNGGILYTPTFLKPKENAVNPLAVRVIKPETSDKMRALLRLVVADGTGKKANTPGYFVGGKTGTAEKLEGGKYSTNSSLSSFIGVFPANKPKYVVLAIIDDPKGNKESFGFATGGWTAAPVVGNVISQIGPMLGVMPVDDKAQDIVQEFVFDYKTIDHKPGRQHLADNQIN